MKKTKPFYNSRTWKKCRAFVLLRDNYLCQQCLKKNKLTPANTVHHIMSLEDVPELALDPDNLESVCPSCHNKEHPEKGSRKKRQSKKKTIRVIKSMTNDEVI